MKNLGGYLVPYEIRTNTIAPGCKKMFTEFYSTS